MTLAWSDIGAMTACGSLVAALLWWALLGKLGKDFVSKGEIAQLRTSHTSLNDRVNVLDERLQKAPSGQEMADVRKEISSQSREIGSLKASLEGVRDTGKRTEHMVEMLLMTQLGKEERT